MRSQPPPSPYLTQLKKYMPRPRRIGPILALVIGASSLTFFVNWPEFDRLAGIRTKRYSPDQWQNAPIRPQLPPEKLINEPEALAAFVTTTEPKDDTSTVHYLGTTEKRHSYVAIFRPYDVPEAYWTRFTNRDSWWPFHWMLHFFPPRGGQTSRRAPISADEWPQQIEFQKTLVKDNKPPGGTISLGHASEVIGSSPTIIDTGEIVARCVLMSTSPQHPLDGHTLWCHITNRKTRQSRTVMYGEGSNKIPGMDAANNHFAGLVFGVMMWHSMEKLHIFARRNSQAIRDDGTWNSADTASRQELSPELRRALSLADITDPGAGVLAWLRQLLGAGVTGPPEIDPPAQVSVVEIPDHPRVKAAVIIEAIQDPEGGSAVIVGTGDNLQVAENPDGSLRLSQSGTTTTTDVPVAIESLDEEAIDTTEITKALQGTGPGQNQQTKTD